mmetsp:Transcript_20494/g.33285  ORF Transcript_20494/g.33285 Transcript_20494/m.33285 type:complete len:85 (-) Transcript_20494:140-394(-)
MKIERKQQRDHEIPRVEIQIKGNESMTSPTFQMKKNMNPRGRQLNEGHFLKRPKDAKFASAPRKVVVEQKRRFTVVCDVREVLW